MRLLRFTRSGWASVAGRCRPSLVQRHLGADPSGPDWAGRLQLDVTPRRLSVRRPDIRPPADGRSDCDAGGARTRHLGSGRHSPAATPWRSCREGVRATGGLARQPPGRLVHLRVRRLRIAAKYPRRCFQCPLEDRLGALSSGFGKLNDGYRSVRCRFDLGRPSRPVHHRQKPPGLSQPGLGGLLRRNVGDIRDPPLTSRRDPVFP